MPTRYNFTQMLPQVIHHAISRHLKVLSEHISEWISGDSSSLSDWAPENTADFTSMYTMLTNKGEYQEIAERPQDGTLYFSMKKVTRNALYSISLTCNFSDRDYLGKFTHLLICEKHSPMALV